jgi:hypothetical protein
MGRLNGQVGEMNEIKKAMKKAWEDWHKGIPAELLPRQTMTLEYGFKTGVEYEKKRAADQAKKEAL